MKKMAKIRKVSILIVFLIMLFVLAGPCRASVIVGFSLNESGDLGPDGHTLYYHGATVDGTDYAPGGYSSQSLSCKLPGDTYGDRFVTIVGGVNPGGSQVSFVSWVKLDSAGWGAGQPYHVYGGAVNAPNIDEPGEFQLWLEAGARRPFFTIVDSVGAQQLNGPSVIPFDTWTHIAVVFNGGTLTMYVDGSPVANTTIASAIPSASCEISIGTGSADNQWLGRIDEFAIYDIALTGSDIQDIMSDGIVNLNSLFSDVTSDVGLTGLQDATRAWGDYDNDGWVDLTTGGQLWKNNAGNNFSLVSGIGGMWADYNNDGHLDLFSRRNLYENLGNGSFTSVGSKIPALPMVANRAQAVADYNNDGYVDFYITGYENPAYEPDALYINNGAVNFTKSWQTPAGQELPARGVTACDFDEDGDQDIYVSNYRLAGNLLWLNDGTPFPQYNASFDYGIGGHYTPGDVHAYGHTIGSCWGDFNNDGHFDLFVGNFRHNWDDGSQDYAAFYRNNGAGDSWHFELMTQLDGSDWQESYASPALGDYDNDGYLDLFYTDLGTADSCVLYRNNGNWTFTNVTGQSGIAMLQAWQTCWADYNNDGYLDLIVDSKLYRNNGGNNHYLKVRLAGDGVKVNSAAIGAQVRIDLGPPIGILTRQVEGGTGEGNQNDLTLHFGLGDNTDPVELQIDWPDGTTQYVNTEVDRLVVVQMEICPDADLSRNCEVGLEDFALFAIDWLKCTDPAVAECDQYWQ